MYDNVIMRKKLRQFLSLHSLSPSFKTCKITVYMQQYYGSGFPLSTGSLKLISEETRFSCPSLKWPALSSFASLKGGHVLPFLSVSHQLPGRVHQSLRSAEGQWKLGGQSDRNLVVRFSGSWPTINIVCWLFIVNECLACSFRRPQWKVTRKRISALKLDPERSC